MDTVSGRIELPKEWEWMKPREEFLRWKKVHDEAEETLTKAFTVLDKLMKAGKITEKEADEIAEQVEYLDYLVNKLNPPPEQKPPFPS